MTLRQVSDACVDGGMTLRQVSGEGKQYLWVKAQKR